MSEVAEKQGKKKDNHLNNSVPYKEIKDFGVPCVECLEVEGLKWTSGNGVFHSGYGCDTTWMREPCPLSQRGTSMLPLAAL